MKCVKHNVCSSMNAIEYSSKYVCSDHKIVCTKLKLFSAITLTLIMYIDVWYYFIKTR